MPCRGKAAIGSAMPSYARAVFGHAKPNETERCFIMSRHTRDMAHYSDVIKSVR